MSAEVIERRLIVAVIKDSTGERWAECRKIEPEAFTTGNLSKLWRNITRQKSFSEVELLPQVAPLFADPATGAEYLADRKEVVHDWLKTKPDEFARDWLAENQRPNAGKIAATLEARRFDFSKVPTEPEPRFMINGRSVCTPGNLTNIIAQAKAGKTAVIAAAIASAICAENSDPDRDTLGITATAPGSKRLIHFDTEQSPFDHYQLIQRAMRRAGVDTAPAWLYSYGCAGFSALDLRLSLTSAADEAEASGGIFAVIIDGTADLVCDVNDAKECNPFVAELHALAIKHDCPILNVVHENPGQDAGKMRGHLGSQLERKAESNLRLKKSEEITTIFSEKMRKAPILEKDGPRFRWSDEAGMHVSCGTVGDQREADSLSDLRDLAAEVFEGKSLRYAEACRKIETARRVGEKAAEKWFTRMKKSNVIQNAGMGLWIPKAA